MRALTIVAWGMLAVCSTVTAARAQDIEGSKDHPMVSRMPGYCDSGLGGSAETGHVQARR